MGTLPESLLDRREDNPKPPEQPEKDQNELYKAVEFLFMLKSSAPTFTEIQDTRRYAWAYAGLFFVGCSILMGLAIIDPNTYFQQDHKRCFLVVCQTSFMSTAYADYCDATSENFDMNQLQSFARTNMEFAIYAFYAVKVLLPFMASPLIFTGDANKGDVWSIEKVRDGLSEPIISAPICCRKRCPKRCGLCMKKWIPGKRWIAWVYFAIFLEFIVESLVIALYSRPRLLPYGSGPHLYSHWEYFKLTFDLNFCSPMLLVILRFNSSWRSLHTAFNKRIISPLNRSQVCFYLLLLSPLVFYLPSALVMFAPYILTCVIWKCRERLRDRIKRIIECIISGLAVLSIAAGPFLMQWLIQMARQEGNAGLCTFERFQLFSINIQELQNSLTTNIIIVVGILLLIVVLVKCRVLHGFLAPLTDAETLWRLQFLHQTGFTTFPKKLKETRDVHSNTPLHGAARCGHVESVQRLLYKEKEEDELVSWVHYPDAEGRPLIDAHNVLGRTALMEAARKRTSEELLQKGQSHLLVAKTLLNARADLEARGTASSICKQCDGGKRNPNCPDCYKNWTPLMHAAHQGRAEMVECFMINGADDTKIDTCRRTVATLAGLNSDADSREQVEKALLNYPLQTHQINKAYFDNVNIAFAGELNVGKSSLINTLRGSKDAAVDDFECTTEIAQYPFHEKTDDEGHGFVFWDVPGSAGTVKKFDTPHGYFKYIGARYFDAVVLVFDGDFKQSMLDLIDHLGEFGIPCYLVRNKIDMKLHDKPKEEWETFLQRERDNVVGKINKHGKSQAHLKLLSGAPYLVSTSEKDEFDFARFEKDLHDVQKMKGETVNVNIRGSTPTSHVTSCFSVSRSHSDCP